MKRDFKDDTHGTVAIVMSIMCLALISILAFSMDMMIVTKTKAQMQASLDIAVLAALQKDVGPRGIARRDAFNASFDAHTDRLGFIDGDIARGISFERQVDSINAQARASALLDLPFGSILNQEIRINVETGAQFAMPKLELALVLDISTSMRGSKINELRNATTQVVDQVLDGRSDSVLSVVPFGGSVRLPPAMRRLLGSTPPNPNLFWFNGTWNHCLKYERDDLRDGFGPSAKHDPLPDFWLFSKDRNSWCPRAGSEAVFATRDNAAAQSLIDTFVDANLADGTSTDVGVNWGVNALSRRWEGKLPGAERDFPARPGTTTKVMVVMSDGSILNHREPSNIEINGRAGHPQLGNSRHPLYRTDRRISGFNANSHMQATCARARADGIIIFSIAFDVDSAPAQASLENCAGDPSRYFVADAGSLLLVFEEILDNVAALRLTG